jgi:pimeloyl-ACP methyl ester carboxylesterase
MKVHLIHGIHTEGLSPIEGLRPLMPWPAAYPDYGWIAGLETKVANPIVVGCLKPYIEPEDILIGHSNGCAVAFDLLNQGVQVKGAVFVNAALEQGIRRPPKCPWIHVYFNPGDEITEAAKLGAELGLVDPVWGEMGHGGYLGDDPQIFSTDCSSQRDMPRVWGHSDFFSPRNLPDWGAFLVARVGEWLGRG